MLGAFGSIHVWGTAQRGAAYLLALSHLWFRANDCKTPRTETWEVWQRVCVYIQCVHRWTFYDRCWFWLITTTKMCCHTTKIISFLFILSVLVLNSKSFKNTCCTRLFLCCFSHLADTAELVIHHGGWWFHHCWLWSLCNIPHAMLCAEEEWFCHAERTSL